MTMQATDERLTLSVEEAAARLGIGRRAAYTAIAKNQLYALRLGRKLRVPVASLEKMLAGPPATEQDR